MESLSSNSRSLTQLGKSLNVTAATLYYFAENVGKHTQARSKRKAHGGRRKYLAPDDRLKKLQRSIKEVYLDGYEYPSYTFGLGIKTLREHAEVHANAPQLIQMDMCDFFPSISHTRVYEAWNKTLGVPSESARVLTKLTTLKGELQQGFPTSSHLAAIVAEPFMRHLERYCKTNGIVFSQYVDDLNFSGTEIDLKKLFQEVIKLSRENEFSMKRAKARVFNQHTGRNITGVSVFRKRTRATRAARHRAIVALKDFAASPENEHNQRRVKGHLLFLKHLHPRDAKKYKANLLDIVRSHKKDKV